MAGTTGPKKYGTAISDWANLWRNALMPTGKTKPEEPAGGKPKRPIPKPPGGITVPLPFFPESRR